MRVSASRALLCCISCGVRRRLFRLSCVTSSLLPALVLAQMFALSLSQSDVVPPEEVPPGEVKCVLCEVVLDGSNEATTCETCGGKKHPILCGKCYYKHCKEVKLHDKSLPFQVRVVLKEDDAGPLHGDRLGNTFPTCLRPDPQWFLDFEEMEVSTLSVARAMLDAGEGNKFTSEDKSIIMKACRRYRDVSGSDDRLREVFSLMMPYLGKGKGKKPTSIGVPKTGVKPAKKAAANKPAKKAAKPAKKTAAK